jgi:acetyltransferase-like isoleucine patch superfamily enzyme
MTMKVTKTFDQLIRFICSHNSRLFKAYLRKKGVSIGKGTEFFGRSRIDITRPHLIEIGEHCMFAPNVTLLTHGFDWVVLTRLYNEILGSSGKIVIQNNVFIGANTTILKGVTIGKNTIIGSGSIVTKNIPRNSVAVGNPCKRIMSIEEYYEKRKLVYVEEAKELARQIYRKTGKIPRITDFWEEFPIFLKRDNKDYPKVIQQFGPNLDRYLKEKPFYDSFEEFLEASGVPVDKNSKNTK